MTLTIALDRSSGVYCVGVGNMHHVEVSTDMDGNSTSTTYQGSKLYEDYRADLFDDYISTPGQLAQLPAGVAEHHFAFTVRPNAPGSTTLRINGTATILYFISARITLDNGLFPTALIPITILPAHPIASPTLLRAIEYKCNQPVELSSIQFLSCCFGIGNLTIDASLARQAFAPGELLDFHFCVKNNTTQMLEIKVELVCSILLKGSIPTLTGPYIRSFPFKVKHVLRSEVLLPNNVLEIGHENASSAHDQALPAAATTKLNYVRMLEVPPVPPTFHGAPGVNRLEPDPVTYAYEIKFSAKSMGMLGSRASVSFPVVICAAPPSALMLQSAHAINSSQPAIQQLAARERDPFSLSYDVTYVPVVAVRNDPIPFDSHPIGSLMEDIRATKSSADLRATVRAWAASPCTDPSAVHDLSPESLQRVLQSIPVDTDQVAVAHELAQLVHCCTCAHVVTALEVCPSLATEMVSEMVSYVQDRENKVFVLGLLPEVDQEEVNAMFG